MRILTASQMRDVDRLTTERYGIPSLALMENAGRSVAEFLRQGFPAFLRGRITVLCGKGNNGGDGFVVARHLKEMGASPMVILFARPEELRGDAAINFQRWKTLSAESRTVMDSASWQAVRGDAFTANIIVDALLGTGTRGSVEGVLREAIDDLNSTKRNPRSEVVAVDIPSGLQADTGEVCGAAVVAGDTISFTAPKPGVLTENAGEYVGNLVVSDIGSPPELIEEVGTSEIRWSEPREFKQFAVRRKPAGHKGDYGHALIVAGSVGKTGAAVLSSWATLRVGAGLVTVATPEPTLATVAAHNPEIMTEPLPATEAGTISARSLERDRFAALSKGKSAIGIGPGLSTNDETQNFIRAVVTNRTNIPIILDADGLNAFAGRAKELKSETGSLALTPHPGEMSRLVGRTTTNVQAKRIELALQCARDWRCYLILKGHQTVTATPDGRAWINSTGNPGMATGGTGDVLTGMLSGLTAQYGTNSWGEMLSFGVYLHGLAGDLAATDVGEAPLMASDIIRFIPAAYRRFYAEIDRD